MMTVTKPRRFVTEWLHFHRMNIIAVKELFYLHLREVRK